MPPVITHKGTRHGGEEGVAHGDRRLRESSLICGWAYLDVSVERGSEGSGALHVLHEVGALALVRRDDTDLRWHHSGL